MRARCELVYQYFARLGDEQLHAHHADEVDLLRDEARQFLSRRRYRRGHAGRHNGNIQNVICVDVLRDGEHPHRRSG